MGPTVERARRGGLVVALVLVGFITASSCNLSDPGPQQNSDNEENHVVNQDNDDPQAPSGSVLTFCGAGGVSENGTHRLVHCTAPVEVGGQLAEGGGYRWYPGAFEPIAE